MKRLVIFFKLVFFSVFATTKMLEKVEEDIAILNGAKDLKPSAKRASETGPQ